MVGFVGRAGETQAAANSLFKKLQPIEVGVASYRAPDAWSRKAKCCQELIAILVVHSSWIQVIRVSFDWIELKSLILAQIERWRNALHMQVERQRGGNPGGERRTGE